MLFSIDEIKSYLKTCESIEDAIVNLNDDSIISTIAPFS